MSFNIGDLVTRKSYNNDTVFKIISIDNDIATLKGVNIRLFADSEISDLEHVENKNIKDDKQFLDRFDINLDRNEYFYLPGKVLHIDGDEDYLERCMEFYKQVHVKAIGFKVKEDSISNNIKKLLEEYNPDILVITGHDAYYKRKGEKNNINAYKNSSNFVEAIKKARRYEKSHEKLIIIAGACQSDYEELIKAGANFASSPKRINIHALDPAVIATKMSLSNVNEDIDLKKLLETTKYGKDGIGGIKTKGTMYVGYPR